MRGELHLFNSRGVWSEEVVFVDHLSRERSRVGVDYFLFHQHSCCIVFMGIGRGAVVTYPKNTESMKQAIIIK